jgi:hypothetical protein
VAQSYYIATLAGASGNSLDTISRLLTKANKWEDVRNRLNAAYLLRQSKDITKGVRRSFELRTGDVRAVRDTSPLNEVETAQHIAKVEEKYQASHSYNGIRILTFTENVEVPRPGYAETIVGDPTPAPLPAGTPIKVETSSLYVISALLPLPAIPPPT